MPREKDMSYKSDKKGHKEQKRSSKSHDFHRKSHDSSHKHSRKHEHAQSHRDHDHSGHSSHRHAHSSHAHSDHTHAQSTHLHSESNQGHSSRHHGSSSARSFLRHNSPKRSKSLGENKRTKQEQNQGQHRPTHAALDKRSSQAHGSSHRPATPDTGAGLTRKDQTDHVSRKSDNLQVVYRASRSLSDNRADRQDGTREEEDARIEVPRSLTGHKSGRKLYNVIRCNRALQSRSTREHSPSRSPRSRSRSQSKSPKTERKSSKMVDIDMNALHEEVLARRGRLGKHTERAREKKQEKEKVVHRAGPDGSEGEGTATMSEGEGTLKSEPRDEPGDNYGRSPLVEGDIYPEVHLTTSASPTTLIKTPQQTLNNDLEPKPRASGDEWSSGSTSSYSYIESESSVSMRRRSATSWTWSEASVVHPLCLCFVCCCLKNKTDD